MSSAPTVTPARFQTVDLPFRPPRPTTSRKLRLPEPQASSAITQWPNDRIADSSKITPQDFGKLL